VPLKTALGDAAAPNENRGKGYRLYNEFEQSVGKSGKMDEK